METTCNLMIARRAALAALTGTLVTMVWACSGLKDHAGSSVGGASARGDACLYRGRDGREITVQFSAQGAQVAGIRVAVPDSMPDTRQLDSGAQKIVGAFSKALGMPGMGAAVSRGLKTDTTMAGPWDTAALVNGSWLLLSKDDVGLTIILGTADYDKAKALLAAACERL